MTEESEHEIHADNGDVLIARVCDEPNCVVVERFMSGGALLDDGSFGCYPSQTIDIPADIAALVGKALIALAPQAEEDCHE